MHFYVFRQTYCFLLLFANSYLTQFYRDIHIMDLSSDTHHNGYFIFPKNLSNLRPFECFLFHFSSFFIFPYIFRTQKNFLIARIFFFPWEIDANEKKHAPTFFYRNMPHTQQVDQWYMNFDLRFEKKTINGLPVVHLYTLNYFFSNFKPQTCLIKTHSSLKSKKNDHFKRISSF